MKYDTKTDELVRSVIDELWNRGDLGLADDVFSSDYVNHGGLIPDALRGPEAIKFSVSLYRSAFPELLISVDDVTSQSGGVLIRWVAHQQPSEVGVMPPGRALRGITRCRLRGGKVAESWTAWDTRMRLIRAHRSGA
jgi:hypothetical protein